MVYIGYENNKNKIKEKNIKKKEKKRKGNIIINYF